MPAGDELQAAIDRAVASFQAGERREESFRFLFETYHHRIRGFFARRTDSVEDCLDLTQETFLRVYRGLESFRREAPFGAWIYRIATNVASGNRRWRGARAGAEPVAYGLMPPDRSREGGDPTAVGFGAGVAPTGLETVVEDEERSLLRRAIEGLPEQRRKCIVLWAYHGLSYEQIATVLGVALGTVKAHLAQAKEQLCRRIEGGEVSRR